MTVRAKMKCESVVSENKDGSGIVLLRPVISGSEENDKFFKFTPSGELRLCAINAEAVSQFEEGKEYYVDISPA